MDKAYWQERWQTNQIGFNQSQANPLMQKYFPKLNLEARARVFVPLCGKSIDMIWLIRQGYQVVGVELSPAACQQFFKENNMAFSSKQTKRFSVFKSENIILFAGDFFQLTLEMMGHIDVVYDRAALIALPLEMRINYSRHLSSLIASKTQMLLISTFYKQSEMPGPPFAICEEEITQLYDNHFTIEKLYDKNFKEIPPHLKAKGLMHASEHVYHLIKMPVAPREGSVSMPLHPQGT